jgi:hypothetical protein
MQQRASQASATSLERLRLSVASLAAACATWRRRTPHPTITLHAREETAMPHSFRVRHPLHAFAVSVCCTIASLSCLAAGPLEADPRHHRLEFENELVRVIRTDWPAKDSSAGLFDVHDAVVVRLTPARFRVTFADGKAIERPSNLGSVYFTPAGTFKIENLLDERASSIVVEFKGRGMSDTQLPPLYPLMADARHHSLIFENDEARVIRAVWGPGETAAGFFDAPGAVIVALTPLQFEVTLPDGQKIYNRAPAGAAMWYPAGRIRPRNAADMTAEFIVVEPKTGR